MKKITFKIKENYCYRNSFLYRPEISGLMIMEKIISGEGGDITALHELEMIWFYNKIKNNQKLSLFQKKKAVKSLFGNIHMKFSNKTLQMDIIDMKVEKLNGLNKFNFDIEIVILLEKTVNGKKKWKDISSLDMNSNDTDISTWDGFINFSNKIIDIITDFEI